MIKINRDVYDLLLSRNPCELFEFFGVNEMHGLSLSECLNHSNTKESSYIAGLCNFIPHDREYSNQDRCFVYINLDRCNSDLETFGHIFHELMHLSFNKYDNDISKEEQMISYCELESKEIFNIIKEYL